MRKAGYGDYVQSLTPSKLVRFSRRNVEGRTTLRIGLDLFRAFRVDLTAPPRTIGWTILLSTPTARVPRLTLPGTIGLSTPPAAPYTPRPPR